ncbi:serine/threonine-protein phosphatase PP1-beta-like [Zingiber officinale]|uniref:Uncharacterized protein n=1 Tax=Zingiber officinale TaxID=94328 RepID=A0A8J5HHE6_ZINOF|nr:serine/threonine-protein phosphatase PP1-beta-like [Zingiber officinale]KAG6524532.1 hypothetical protein ZIOFF_014444 [Zingiber officinale]
MNVLPSIGYIDKTKCRSFLRSMIWISSVVPTRWWKMANEFVAKRQLLTIFSAPDYCGEFDNAGDMLSVDETLIRSFQILKPADKKKGLKNNFLKPETPPRKGPSISQKTSQQANPAAFLSAPQ